MVSRSNLISLCLSRDSCSNIYIYINIHIITFILSCKIIKSVMILDSFVHIPR